MKKCWNCLSPIAEKAQFCPDCGQHANPNAAQMASARKRLEYLLHESAGWTFLPPEVRQGLSTVYQARANRLESLASADSSQWPETDWTDPIWSRALSTTSEPLPAGTEKLRPADLSKFLAAQPILEPLTAAGIEREDGDAAPTRPPTLEPESSGPPVVPEAQVEPTLNRTRQAALHRLAETTGIEPSALIEPTPDNLAEKILAEADIRWFHSLGALLVVAAVVGWLRATWDGYGKNLAGTMILLSPAALHAIAHQLRASVPISARLLAILGGLLTPLALLSVDIFDFLPGAISGRDYWTFALLASGSLLAWQAQATRERIPLYTGALCTAMAGWSQSPLLTSALCLIIGFLLAPVVPKPDASLAELEWNEHLRKVGFAAGLFGCFAALFVFQARQGSLKPLLAFSGALIYLHLPTLTRRTGPGNANRVVLQACITVLGILLMRAILDVPASGVGLYTLLAAALFLSARPEDEGGLLALRVGSLLGLMGLAIGFFSSNPVPPGHAQSDPAETVLRFVLACFGAGLLGHLSRQAHLRSQSTLLGIGAMLATFGGWYHLFLMACRPIEGDYFRENGQLAPLYASFGLWVVLWLLGSNRLRPCERPLVQAVALSVLLYAILVCAWSGIDLGPASQSWSLPLLWLGAVSLAWERRLLAPRAGSPGWLLSLLSSLLPRLALWALALGAVFTEALPHRDLPIPVQALGMLLLLSPAAGYRRPALEMVWLVAPSVFVCHWQSAPLPGQVLEMWVLFAAGWAADTRRAASLAAAAGLGLGILVASLQSASHLALLTLPATYGLCVLLPFPGRGPYTRPAPAQYGFDLLLNAALFFPLSLENGSPASFGATAGVPVLAILLSSAARHHLWCRVVSRQSAHWLVLCGFLWTLGQGPQESGVLMLLASIWAFTLPETPGQRLTPRDLANGLALLGLAWLTGESHFYPNLGVLSVGLVTSECLAIASARWRPDRTNTALLVAVIALSSRPETSLPALGVSLLAGLLAGIRGFSANSPTLMVAGLLAFLKVADGQLSLADASFKLRLFPLAMVLISMSLALLAKPDNVARVNPGCHPLTSLRLGLALLSAPALLSLAVTPTLGDFAWVLTVGCSCLAVSQGFADPEVKAQIKQAGGYVLTGWAGVSLGRAAMILPWQLATLMVGLVMVGVGVKVEKSRKKSER